MTFMTWFSWHVAIDIHERLATVEAKLERLQ